MHTLAIRTRLTTAIEADEGLKTDLIWIINCLLLIATAAMAALMIAR